MSVNKVMSKISMHSAKNFPMDFFKSKRKENSRQLNLEIPDDRKGNNPKGMHFVNSDTNSRNRVLKPITKRKSGNYSPNLGAQRRKFF